MVEIGGLSPEELISLKSFDAVASMSSKGMDTQAWRGEFESFHKRLPGNTILELGVGTAADSHFFLDAGFNHVGIDISQGMLDEARKREPSANFARMNMYSLGFASDSFDGFWAPASLYFVPKRKISSVLEEIRRVTKNGAVGFVAVPMGKGEGLVHGKTDSAKPYKAFVANYGRKEFEEILVASQFDILERRVRDPQFLFTVQTNKKT